MAVMNDIRPRFTVETERDERWWAIRVAELPGVFSQARTRHEVEPMARDAIALLLDVHSDAFELTVRERHTGAT